MQEQMKQKEILQAKTLKDELKATKMETKFIQSLKRQAEEALKVTQKIVEEHKIKKEIFLEKQAKQMEQQAAAEKMIKEH